MSAAVVRSMWDAIQRRAWRKVTEHFAKDAQMFWPASGESFDGRDGIISVNEKYPEGWSVDVLAVDELVDGRVVSQVKVSHPPREYFAVSFYGFSADLIVNVDEYWSTKEDPEPWRNEQTIPGWSRRS